MFTTFRKKGFRVKKGDTEEKCFMLVQVQEKSQIVKLDWFKLKLAMIA